MEAPALEEVITHDHRADGGDRRSWSTPLQAAGLIVRGATARTATPIAVVVGTLLSLVNQAQVVAGGHADGTTWVRIGINYAIPFIVASIGCIAPFRSRGSRQSDTSVDLPADPVDLDADVRPGTSIDIGWDGRE